MTSIVDTSVKHAHSSMLNAMVLNGVAGSMVSVLDAFLVTGWDVKAGTSLTVVNGVATLAFAGTHGATVDSVIAISGVTGALVDLNGEQKIKTTGAGYVSFATAAADGTAAGTLSFKMAPAGWSTTFTATNIREYHSTDPASTGMRLRVDDTTALTCRVVGYESMTGINSGAGAFPSDAQMPGGGYWSKSSVATAAPQSWLLVADGRKLFLHVAPYFSAGARGGVTRSFGDEVAVRPGGDPYACSLSYSAASEISNQADGGVDFGLTLQQAMPRSFTGLGSSVLHVCACYTGNSLVVSGADPALGPFPSAVDGGIRLSKKYLTISQPGTSPRADVPGLYSVPMSLAFDTFKTRDTIEGTGDLTGRRLMALNPTSVVSAFSSNANTGVSFVDITGPWR